MGNLVGTGVHQAVQDRGDARRCRGEIRAEVSPDLRPQAGNHPISCRRYLDILDVVAAVGRGDIVLAAALGPLDRPVKLLGGESYDCFIGVVVDFAPEATADFRGDDPQLMLRDTEHPGHEDAMDVRVLGGEPNRHFFCAGVPLRDGRPRLHRVRDEALVVEPMADGDFGLLERCVSTLAGHHPAEGGVGRHIVVKLRRAILRGLFLIHDGRQLFVFDFHHVSRVGDRSAIFADDDCHAVAHVAHAVYGQRRVVGHDEVGVGNEPRTRDIPHPALQVAAGIDGDDTRLGCGCAGIYAGDTGVGIGTADDHRIGHVRKLDVIAVGGLAGNQTRIFAPPDRGSK